MSIKAIIFDCDGTLVDSEEAHFHSWQHAIKQFGSTLSQEEYFELVGKSGPTNARILAEKAGFHDIDTAEDLLTHKKEHFAKSQLAGLPSIVSTVEFAKKLYASKHEHGLKIGLASATYKHEILINLKSLGLENCFDVILSGYDDLKHYEDSEGVNKPKPYIYLEAAKILGLDPSECLVIEDTLTGVTAGSDAGCFTLAIPHQYSKYQDLSLATLKMDSLEGVGVEELLALVSDATLVSV